jgi:hypothetical protein
MGLIAQQVAERHGRIEVESVFTAIVTEGGPLDPWEAARAAARFPLHAAVR